MGIRVSGIAALAFAATLCSALAQAATLQAIGADANGVGRVYTAIDPAGSGVALGDGSWAFNGGIAWSAAMGTVAAIENDSNGNSWLTSFSPASPTALATPIALGQGFLGGLAFDSGDNGLYAIASDATGASSLYRVGSGGATRLGALGFGFYGGLTYDAANGSFYAIGADSSFEQRRVSRIDLGSGSPVVTTVFDLGDGSVGFTGGLAWDESSGRFMTIGSNSAGTSSLYSFALSSASSLVDRGVVGTGFASAGLAYVPAVPEPSSAVMLVVGLAGLAALRRHGRHGPG